MSLQLTDIWRYPVKSCRGERLTEAVVVIARSSQEGIVVNLQSLWPSPPADSPA